MSISDTRLRADAPEPLPQEPPVVPARGRARRYEGFEATIALAEQCGGCPLTKFELQAAVRYCPELSRTEAVLLGEYIDVIDHDRIATGEAFGYIAMDLGG